MRTRQTKLEAACKKLRTIAWTHNLRRAIATREGFESAITWNQLAQRLARRRVFGSLDDSKIFYRYAKGNVAPNESKLKLFENTYPGTRDVFDNGPDGSRLWSVFACKKPEELLSEIERDFKKGLRLEWPVLIAGSPRVQDCVVPASLAARIGLCKIEPRARMERFARFSEKHRDVRDSLGASDSGLFAHFGEGPLIDLDESITSEPSQRIRSGLRVWPPVVTSLAIQILRARIEGHETVDLRRQLEIERRLTCFGIPLAAIEKVTGLRFPRVHVEILEVVKQVHVNGGENPSARTSNATPTVRFEFAPRKVRIPTSDGVVEIPGPEWLEIRGARMMSA